LTVKEIKKCRILASLFGKFRKSSESMPRRSFEFFLTDRRCDIEESKSAKVADIKFDAIAISCFFYGCCEFINFENINNFY
jgi:hypothetical protein